MTRENESRKYLESNFDQGDSLLNRTSETYKYTGLQPIFPLPGQRQIPGQDGFRLADTPQAWVFIQKKEWMDESWTYMTTDREVIVNGKSVSINSIISSLESARAELLQFRAHAKISVGGVENYLPLLQVEESKIQDKIKKLELDLSAAREALAKVGTIDQYQGKVIEIDVRNTLGNIIMRKLDWMSDHEKFTKVMSLTDQQVEMVRFEKNRKEIEKILLNEELMVVNNNVELLTESLQQWEKELERWEKLGTLAQQRIDETETSLEEITDPSERQKRLEYIEKLQKIEEQASEKWMNASGAIQENTEKLEEARERQDTVTALIGENLKNFKLTYTKESDMMYAPTTVSGSGYTRYYRSPVFKTGETETSKTIEKDLLETKESLEKNIKSLLKQVRSSQSSEVKQLTKYQREYIEAVSALDKIRENQNAQATQGGIVIESGDMVFNGVIELANISSINTTVTLQGEGNASFTIENPQNIFFISRDDIDLALTEDPFLEKERTLDGTVYYRGRFYPQHIVSMLTSRKGSSVDLGHLSYITDSELTIQKIKDTEERMAELKKSLDKIEEFVSTNELKSIVSGEQDITDVIVFRLMQKQAIIQSEYDDLKSKLDSFKAIMLNKSKKDKSSDEKEKLSKMDLIRQTLLKYYVGKTIFQVLDRVYIWTTSPSRTLHRLNRTGPTDRYAIEDPSAIGLAQQLGAVESQLTIINNEISNLNKFISSHKPVNSEEENLPLEQRTIVAEFEANQTEQIVPKIFTVNENLLTYSQGQRYLTGPESVVYLRSLLTEQSLKGATVDYLRGQVKQASTNESVGTDQATAARTFNKIPTARNKSQAYEDQASAIGQYESRYLGIEEDRVQIFQGVISTVKLTYSDGKYQIQANCRDNMVFLSMSRIMIKPALRADQGPQGILQDPIWRNNELSGHWKNGILVADYAFVNDEVLTRLDKNFKVDRIAASNTNDIKQVGETQGRTAVMPFVTSLPFARIDAANLISFIITGIPYNFEQFLKNAAFGGRWLPERVSGLTDQRNTSRSFFSYLKDQIGEVNDRLGDFEPYIDLLGDQFNRSELEKRRSGYKAAIGTAISILDRVYRRYVTARMDRYFKDLKGNVGVIETSLSDLSTQKINKRLSTYEQKVFLDYTFFDLLVKTVVDFAQEHYMSQTDSTHAAHSGFVAANERQVKFLYDMMLKDKGAWKQLETIIGEQVKEQFTHRQRKQEKQEQEQDKQSIAQKEEKYYSIRSAVNDKIQTTVIEFLRKLLTVQPVFAEEFLALSIAASNLKDFENIFKDLDNFLTRIQKESSIIKGTVLNGAQSTIEKIVRCEKKNFLVISDEYTLDFNLQAYQTEVAKGNPNLFQSEWETPLSICKRAADQVDFEFYADEDGNLQFKPPTYNRILKEHFALISETDSGVRDAILIKFGGNDGQILRAILRGTSVYNNLRNEFATQLNMSKRDLEIIKKDLKKTQLTKDSQTVDIGSVKDVLIDKKGATLLTEQLYGERGDSYLKIKTPLATIEFEAMANGNAKLLHMSESDDLLKIEASARNYRDKVQLLSEVYEEDDKRVRSLRASLDNEELSDQERFELGRSLNIAEKKLSSTDNEQKRLNLTIEEYKVSRKIDLYKSLVEVVDYLLKETEIVRQAVRDKANNTIDSLARFTDENRIHRVADFDLISYDLEESPPRYTYLELTGAPELVELRPAEIYWAGGVDYDNWRNYGFLSENTQKAYFHSGASARTYIRALLGRERGRVFSGTVSVRGDSKYRVGDCIFIESVGMYYYIISVSHSFSYGQSYTTNLTLAYGRRIGELIPHPFDALGKIMIETYQSNVEDLLARERMVDAKGDVRE